MRRTGSAALILAASVLSGCETPDRPRAGDFSVVPLPEYIQPRGGAFALGPDTRLVVEVESVSGDWSALTAGGHPALDGRGEFRPLVPGTVEALEWSREVVENWARPLRRATGFPLPVHGAPDRGWASREIRLIIARDVEGLEGYDLRVRSDGVRVRAETPAGLFYGLQTLRQLLPADGERGGWVAGAPTGPSVGGSRAAGPTGAGASPVGRTAWTIPAVDIRDRPRFAYRGMHLDVGRHFFPVSFVKRYIDLLAAHKLNTFHWHLTEDQGWRLEVQAYPRLTEISAFRAETQLEKNFDPFVGDGVPYGGFYTQEEVRDVVAYAAERFVTVIPEIEMPGHTVAVLAAYPALACTPGPFEVMTRWGVHPDIFCPSEATFRFLEGVLTETMDLFPSPFIHIGGDEAPKIRWEESPLAQEVIRREGLEDEYELQSWFIRRMEGFLNRSGRRLIGWDEILEGGLAPNATVMSWRGVEGGIQAAREGHDVIMSPTSHLYFDYYQGDPEGEPLAIGGFLPLERVYGFEPIPEDLDAGEARHVLGAQANLWTEYIPTESQAEYMAYPRALALAEVVWTDSRRRSWEGFVRRLPRALNRLGAAGVNYRVPDVGGLESDVLSLEDRFTLRLARTMESGSIHYTLDGSDPNLASPRYREPFPLDLSGEPLEVRARLVTEDGRLGPIRGATFRRVALRPADPPGSGGQGLEVVFRQGGFSSVEEMEGTEVAWSRGTDAVEVPPEAPPEYFGLQFSGYIEVPEDGIYTFHLSSDDGSTLRIGGELVVDHDGLHGMSERSGQVALALGRHPVEVAFFQSGGGVGLSLEVTDPSGDRYPLPADWLWRPGA